MSLDPEDVYVLVEFRDVDEGTTWTAQLPALPAPLHVLAVAGEMYRVVDHPMWCLGDHDKAFYRKVVVPVVHVPDLPQYGRAP